MAFSDLVLLPYNFDLRPMALSSFIWHELCSGRPSPFEEHAAQPSF